MSKTNLKTNNPRVHGVILVERSNGGLDTGSQSVETVCAFWRRSYPIIPSQGESGETEWKFVTDMCKLQNEVNKNETDHNDFKGKVISMKVTN